MLLHILAAKLDLTSLKVHKSYGHSQAYCSEAADNVPPPLKTSRDGIFQKFRGRERSFDTRAQQNPFQINKNIKIKMKQVNHFLRPKTNT